MNFYTKNLIETAAREAEKQISDDLRVIREVFDRYNGNLAQLKSYAETLGYNDADVIEPIGVSISEIEEAKQQAMDSQILSPLSLGRLRFTRELAKEKAMSNHPNDSIECSH